MAGSRRGLAGAALACLLTAAPASAAGSAAQSGSPAPHALRGIAFDQTLDDEALPAGLPVSVPVIVRIGLDWRAFVDTPGPHIPRTGFAGTSSAPGMMTLGAPTSRPGASVTVTLERLAARLALYGARSVPVVLALGAFPTDEHDVEPWRTSIRSIAGRGRGKVAAYVAGDVQRGADGLPEPARYAYWMKLASVQIRSIDPDVPVFQGRVPAEAFDWQERVYAAGVAPYENGLALVGESNEREGTSVKGSEREGTSVKGSEREGTSVKGSEREGASVKEGPERGVDPDVERMSALVARYDPSGAIMLGPVPLSARTDLAGARLIDAQLRALGTRSKVTVYRGSDAAVKSALILAARTADLFAGEVVSLDESAAGLRLTRAGVDVASVVPHRLLYSVSGFRTYLVYWAQRAPERGDHPNAAAALGAPGNPWPVREDPGRLLDLDITVANASAVMVRDPLTGKAEKPTRLERTDGGKRLRLALPLTNHPLVVDFNFGSDSTYTLTTEALKPAPPRVEEIVSRYQQAQAAQDAALRNYVAHLRMDQHFHPSPADPEYNIVTENRLFFDRSGVEWEELSFALNGARWTTNRPPFPLVQPEKVLSLPLDLRLNQDYAYRLEGVETVGGRDAFVIRFDPIVTVRALYRGTVWIDRRTFVRLKIQAVETRLAGSVVSNEETHVFAPAGELQGHEVWLLDRLVSRQIFLIAGRNVLVEREIRLSDFQLNAAGFEEARAAARASNRIMYRDTDQGLRYFVKKGESRVVNTELTSSVRAMALGADVDPSFDYPLPIGGLDVLDFNFLNRDMQLALLFGGVVALGNVQRRNLWGGRFDASVDFFGLAVKSADSVFDAGGERRAERIERIPMSTGLNLGWQMTPFQKMSGRYELKYDAYFRDAVTASGFAVPSSTLTHGEGAGYEYRRRGYSFTADAAAYQRAAWKPWGFGAPSAPSARTYARYDAGLSKDFIVGPFQTVHLNATYFGGERLDRFSMYQFGLFDATRMHGVPSAVRFGELAMFRGSYSFNIFDQYRFDVFLDRASGRDRQATGLPGASGTDGCGGTGGPGAQGCHAWVPVTGIGVRFNVRAPLNTILQVDVGRSILPDVYRGAGSTIVQVLLLKPL